MEGTCACLGRPRRKQQPEERAAKCPRGAPSKINFVCVGEKNREAERRREGPVRAYSSLIKLSTPRSAMKRQNIFSGLFP